MNQKDTNTSLASELDNADVTFVCPECKQPVTWEPVELTNETLWCLDWTCHNCGANVINFIKKE